jgi:hypothetical protein
MRKEGSESVGYSKRYTLNQRKNVLAELVLEVAFTSFP